MEEENARRKSWLLWAIIGVLGLGALGVAVWPVVVGIGFALAKGPTRIVLRNTSPVPVSTVSFTVVYQVAAPDRAQPAASRPSVRDR